MTSATDALDRARAELAAAERMGSPEIDVAQAAVEQAEQAVVDERGGCPVCGCVAPDCEDCAANCRGMPQSLGTPFLPSVAVRSVPRNRQP